MTPPPPPPTPMNICPKSYNFLAKVGKLLFWGTSIGIVVPAYYRETVLQFSAIFVEGLIFSPPYYLYVYYYSKVRAFRPMGCTPPVPLRRWLVSSPPSGLFWCTSCIWGCTACGHDDALRFLRLYVYAFRAWASL